MNTDNNDHNNQFYFNKEAIDYLMHKISDKFAEYLVDQSKGTFLDGNISVGNHIIKFKWDFTINNTS